MKKKNFKELYEEFREVLKENNEEKARDFLISHLEEFPKEAQEKIILAFFQEALEKAAEEANLLQDFQAKALNEIKEVEQVKRDLEDRLEIIKTKEEISKLKEN